MGSLVSQFLLSQLIPGLDNSQVLVWLAILVPVGLLLALAITSVFAFDVARTIVTAINDIFKQIRSVLTPPKDKWDSWQILIWISVFSWVTSMLPRNLIIQSFIATVGWLFLIPGIHWFMHEEKLKVTPEINVKKSLTIYDFYFAPWITGALVCLFLFGSSTEGTLPLALICWPPISTIIAILPKFIKIGPQYVFPEKADDRQQIVLLMLSNLLLSCWIGLYFSTQSWLEQYPSILSGDLSRSTFVVDLNPTGKPAARGELLLERAGELVDGQLEGRSWSQVERWLLEREQRMKAIKEEVFYQLPRLEENQLWHLDARTAPRTEYALQLYAIWTGPTADGKGYHLTKTCLITKVPGNRVRPGETSKSTTGVATVNCGEVSDPISGQPNYSQIEIDPNTLLELAPEQSPTPAAPTTTPKNPVETAPEGAKKRW